MGNKNSKYDRGYFSFNYTSADSEIEWVHKRPSEMYPQTRKTFIGIIENAKKLKKNFYLKYEKNGYYGKNTCWWVYSGDTEININNYYYDKYNGNNILCFPSEAKKEIYLAEQRKFYSSFNDGFENYVHIISECEKNNKPFVICAQWGKSNYFTVKKL